jgi:hypothetical protein
MIYKPTIIIPVFKRKDTLSVLLRTMNEADYPYDNIKLVISIEKGASQDVIECVNTYEFKAGNKQIVYQKKKLDVKNHIEWCVSFGVNDGSVIILEDDIIVTRSFYNYVCAALDHYHGDHRIAGVSLYSQRFNETAELPFEPVQTEFSAYFMQLACSWGQAWTLSQWKDYKNWSKNNDLQSESVRSILPENIKKWPDTSWKKDFNMYMISMNKYFVYPYKSYSSNISHSDGHHMKQVGNLFQVPLSFTIRQKENFDFPDFKNFSIVYDSYMEANGALISKFIGISLKNIEIDLYGKKPLKLLKSKEYFISSKKANNAIRSFPLCFKPIEMNLNHPKNSLQGAFFHLYKSETVKKTKKSSGLMYIKLAEYFSYIPYKNRKFVLNFFLHSIRSLIKNSA